LKECGSVMVQNLKTKVSETITVFKAFSMAASILLLQGTVLAIIVSSVNVSHDQYYKDGPIKTIQLPDFL